jgi:hypothetical protein
VLLLPRGRRDSDVVLCRPCLLLLLLLRAGLHSGPAARTPGLLLLPLLLLLLLPLTMPPLAAEACTLCLHASVRICRHRSLPAALRQVVGLPAWRTIRCSIIL